MSVLNREKIDFIGIDKVTKDTILTISDHLNWNEELEHIYILQEKINSYIAFIESDEIYETFPDARNRSIVIKIIFKYEPSALGIEFLKKSKAFYMIWTSSSFIELHFV
jgi:urate oxidase